MLYLIFIILFIVLGSAYSFIIIMYTTGWYKLEDYGGDTVNFNTKISVIIPVRNEEDQISHLLEDLVLQQYPPELFEVIVIDDASTDGTNDVVKRFIQQNSIISIRLLTLKEGSHSTGGKKSAINKGIEAAKGTLIITTDADCRTKPGWLSAIAGYYEDYHPKMIAGPVDYYAVGGFFRKFQAIEFLSLVVSGAGAIRSGHPVMCNGANLVYEKKAFEEVNGFELDQNYASGDDIFLLLKMKKKFGNRAVHFLKSREAIVLTKTKDTLWEFLEQRLRWVSKSKGYKDGDIIFASLVVYLFNLFLLVSFTAGLFIQQYFFIFLFLFCLKLFSDFPALAGISKFTHHKGIMVFYLPFQLFYIPFIAVMGLWGIIGNYHWKERKIIN